MDESQSTEIFPNIGSSSSDASFPPRYLKSTVASSLPPYLNVEVERVANSYRCGSYWSLKKLPNKMRAGNVQLSRKDHTMENLLGKAAGPFVVKSIQKESAMPKFMANDFHRLEDISRNHLESERLRMYSDIRKPFQTSSTRIKTKYEDTFEDLGYQFPYTGPGQCLRGLDAMVRTDVVDESKFLMGAFHLSTGRPEVSHRLTKEWTRRMYEMISKDWPMLWFKVRSTQTDEFLIQFNYDENITSTLFSALSRYMHNFASCTLCTEFGLKKRGDRWGKQEVIVIPHKSHDSSTMDDISCEYSNRNQDSAWITYSMYAPWVTGVRSTNIAASKVQRAEVKAHKSKKLYETTLFDDEFPIKSLS